MKSKAKQKTGYRPNPLHPIEKQLELAIRKANSAIAWGKRMHEFWLEDSQQVTELQKKSNDADYWKKLYFEELMDSRKRSEALCKMIMEKNKQALNSLESQSKKIQTPLVDQSQFDYLQN